MFRFRRLVGLARYVRRIAAPANLAVNRLASITFVETEMLRFARRGLGTRDGDCIQRLGDQLLVRHIGAVDGDGQRDATAIDERRAFDSQLASIGRVFPGFFPHPAVTWSSPRPCSAISSRSHSGRRIRSVPDSIAPRRCSTRPTLGNNRGSRCPNRTGSASPSTGNPFVKHTGFRSPHSAWASEVGRPWDCVGRLGEIIQFAPRDHRKPGETLTTIVRPLAPPCRSRSNFLNLHYGCLQPAGSVIG